MRIRTITRTTLGTALSIVAVLSAAACGDGASIGNAGVADIQAVVTVVGQTNLVTRPQATCIADKATPKLSAKGIKAAKKRSNDLSALPTADQGIVFDAFSACVTTAQLTPSITNSLVSGSQGATVKEAACFSAQLKARYPRSGDLIRELTAGGATKLTESMSKCLPKDQIEQSLITDMVKGGYTEAQATCVVDRVLTDVPLSKLTGSTGGVLPADVQSSIVAATQACS